MDYLLKPFKISEYFTLYEALQWVAGGLPPSDDNIRDDCSIGIDDFLYDVFSHPRSFHIDFDCPFYRRDVSQSEFDESNSEYNAKNEVIRRLIDGKIKAYGHHLFLQKIRKKPRFFSNHGFSDPDIFKPGDEEIPANFVKVDKFLTFNMDLNAPVIAPEEWLRGDVDWLTSSLDLGEERYSNIFLHGDEVQKEFPLDGQPLHLEAQTKKGYFFVTSHLDDEDDSQKRRGRPKLINWEAFICELARLKMRGELPDKQDAAVQVMKEWCLRSFSISPKESALQSRISQFYKAVS